MRKTQLIAFCLLTVSVIMFAPVVKTHAESKVVKSELAYVPNDEVSGTEMFSQTSRLATTDLDTGVEFISVKLEAKPVDSTPRKGNVTPIFHPPV